ncbi:MAG: hypothetical protein HOY79_49975 [Streptomyces sp.]|nr:hypothetical protein [Streptomyces sp.]
MTTMPIAEPLHHPFAAFTAWLRGFRRRSYGVPPADVEALRLSLPLNDPDRHALEAPALEDAFAHLAADHPAQVAVASMRDADRQELLLAIVDDWFRHAHPAPTHRWPAPVRAEHELLLDAVRACFHSAGGAQ